MKQTPPSDEALTQALAVYSAWLGHGHAERAPLWVERLRMNEDELKLFRMAVEPDGLPYVPRQVAPILPPPARTPASVPTGSRLDATEALRRAREIAHLNTFTYLPKAVEPAGTGYLSGVPFAVKDLIGVAGMPRTGGSASEALLPYARDAASVAAMKRQGAVVIGLANLHELAFGATNANPVFGTVVNPVCPDRIPGGSSGGSAAAVAAGIVDVALGTDTGGSIRLPAASAGVVGFMPGHEVVPYEGTLISSPSLDRIGPIGRTVMDCARAFAALTNLPEVPVLDEAPLDGLRVARLGGYFDEPLDTPVRQAVAGICEAMKRDGAGVFDASIAGIELASAIQYITISTEAASTHAQRLREHGDKLGEDVRVRLEMANFLPGHWYFKAQRLRRQLVENIDELFSRADVLLCPTMRARAPHVGATHAEIEGRSYPIHTAVSNLTMPFNLAGLPAITVPWTTTDDGVPIGMQIVGAQGKDWQVLRVAHRLEMLAGKR